MKDNPKLTFAKWLVFMTAELLIVSGSVHCIINPSFKLGLAVSVINVLTNISIFYLGRNKMLGLIIPFVIQLVFSNNLFFFVIVRMICLFFKSTSLWYFSFVSLILILPVTEELLLFNQIENIPDFDVYNNDLEIHNGSVSNFQYSRYYQQESAFLTEIIFSTIKLVFLGITTTLSYLDVNILHLNDIYNGIVFSIAFNAFLRPLFYHIRNKIVNKKLDKNIKDLEIQMNDIKDKLDDFFIESKNQNEVFMARFFIKRISKEYPKMDLKTVKNLNENYYIYIKESSFGYFNKNIYMKTDRVLIKELYEWSKNNRLKKIPADFE